MLLKLRAYVKSYVGQTKWMYFLIEDDDLLEKYNTICVTSVHILKKEFDSEPINQKKFLKTKIKSYSDQSTDFRDKEIERLVKGGLSHTCLAVITLESTL